MPVVASIAVLALSVGMLSGFLPGSGWLPAWLLWLAAAGAAAVAANEMLGKPVPFLRWSFVRMMLGIKTLTSDWQVGDGREERVARQVLARARQGDVDDVIAVIDRFAYRESYLINVGDEKGAILDAALDRVQPLTVLELGTYVGYSALRMARRLPPGGRIISVEFNPDNAAIARRILAHAGVNDRVEVVVGTLGDGGQTLDQLQRGCGLAQETLDLVFIDHAKEAYLPDLQRILDRGWLRRGAVVVADNIKFPGAPEYRAYMQQQQGKLWRSTEHATHAEYQSVLPDIVLESEYLGPPG